MTTDEAFEQVINTRGIYHTLNMTEQTVLSMRLRFKKKPASVKFEKKISIIQHAGYKIATELTWVKAD